MQKKVKIKSIQIKGVRGVKNTLSIPLDEKSLLIYGDNGTGKSTITDSIEWYMKDEVRHLSSSEIDLKEAIRNSNLAEEEESFIEIDFNKSGLKSKKSLSLKRGKYVPQNSNITTDFNEYIDSASNENLILRYQYLTEFIEKPRGEKLKSLSDVIGFSDVNKTKDVLRKAFNSIKSDLKSQNYENQINTQKDVLKEKIGAIVSVENNFIEKVSEIIKPLKLDIELKSIIDIDSVLTKLKAPLNNPVLNQYKFLESSKNIISLLKNEVSVVNSAYATYSNEFNSIAGDVQSIMQTFLAEMLKAGHTVIEKKYHKEDSCPMCLQSKKQDDLLKEIASRLKAIEESSKKKAAYDNSKQLMIKIADERIKRLAVLINDPLINEQNNKNIKDAVTVLNNKLLNVSKSANEKITSGNKINGTEEVELVNNDFAILEVITNEADVIKKALEKDNTTTIYSNISAAKDAFIRIKKFEAERIKLESQKKSLELIFNEFVKKQKEALDNFISTFSSTINEYYQFMNPGEQFDDIRIATMGEEDELIGIKIEYKYRNEWVSPPQKYFSESHLNCFGIAFFLTSVKAFNKLSDYIVLDDVISSFDSNHRKRFADLLIEKFSDLQIILLTHEKHWFEYVRSVVKNKGWGIMNVKWSEEKGTYFDETPGTLKEKIEKKISSSSDDKLGNDIREYLEGVLKVNAVNLEVKLKFQFNDRNEDRMAYELLTELKSRFAKSTSFASHSALIDRTLASTFIGNKDSHDSSYTPSMGDLKAFWKDVTDIEKLFYCDACKTSVHLKYYDEANKLVKCKCGTLNYDIKK